MLADKHNPTYLETARLLGLQPQQLALLDRLLLNLSPTDMKARLNHFQVSAALLFHELTGEYSICNVGETLALTFLSTVQPVLQLFTAGWVATEYGQRLPGAHMSIHDGRYLFFACTMADGTRKTSEFYDAVGSTGALLKELPDPSASIVMFDLGVMILRFFGRLKAERELENTHASSSVAAEAVSGNLRGSRDLRHHFAGGTD